MPHSLEERVAYLEGKVEEQTRNFGELTGRIDGLSTRIDGLSARIDALSARLDGLDQKVDRFRGELSARIDGLDQKISSQFVWLVGMQVAVLLAVIGALLQ